MNGVISNECYRFVLLAGFHVSSQALTEMSVHCFLHRLQGISGKGKILCDSVL